MSIDISVTSFTEKLSSNVFSTPSVPLIEKKWNLGHFSRLEFAFISVRIGIKS